MTETDVRNGRSVNDNTFAGQCGVLVLYVQSGTAQAMFGQLDGRGKDTCWGVTKGGWKRYDMPPIFNQPRTGLRLSRANPSDWTKMTPDYCRVVQDFALQNGNGLVQPYAWYAISEQAECRMAPSVSRCEINIPGVIQHRTTTAGVVNSVEGINAEISCNRTTNVRVTVPGNLVLSQGNNEITSLLSLGGGGASNIIVSPNPSTNFKITSTISATNSYPGTYSGQFVVVAEWD